MVKISQIPGLPSIPGAALPVPGGAPPVTGEILGFIPPVESCVARIELTINGMKSGILGKTRQSQKIDVAIKFCRNEYEALFTQFVVKLTLNTDSPELDVILTPSTGWYESVMMPFADNDGVWLPKGTYTYKAKIVDYKLVAGISVPELSITEPQYPNLPNITPETQEPQEPQVPQLPSAGTTVPNIPALPSLQKEVQLPSLGEIVSPEAYRPSNLGAVKINETQFPPTVVNGTIKPQPTKIDTSSPVQYVDDGAIIYALMTAPEENTIDSRVNGTIVFKYTDRTGNIKTINVSTSGVNETEVLGEVGRGTFYTTDMTYGKHSIDMTFDGYEVIGTKRVETLESVTSKVNIELIRRPVSMSIDVI